MPYEAGVNLISTLKSTADLSAATNQFKLVKLASGELVVSAAATDTTIGVLQNKPKAGETAIIVLIQSGGIGKCRAGAAVTAGVQVISDADGDVIASATPTTDFVIGTALDAATAAGDIITVIFHPWKLA